jgi:hypothetical protein
VGAGERRPKSTGGNPETSRIAKKLLLQQLVNPPFNRPIAEIAKASDTQLILFFEVERDPETGNAVIRSPAVESAFPTAQRFFERQCYLNGITDPEAVARLWAKRQAGDEWRPTTPDN